MQIVISTMRLQQPAAPALIAQAPSAEGMTLARTLLFAFAVGVIVQNLASSQPLVAVIAPSLGLGPGWSGAVTTAVFFGYAIGLVLVVPLSDLFENRRLALAMLAADALALLSCAYATSAATFLAASFAVGASMSCVQVLVPLAASLTHESARGRTVGNVMSGVMIGVLLSRPLATLIADAFGWRGVFVASAIAILALIALLASALPQRRPAAGMAYVALIRSLWTLAREERVLRIRATSAALAFAAFNVFWTTIALRLAAPPFDLGARGIAAFAFAGVGGAIAAPLAGRWGDRGWTRPVMVVSHLAIVIAFTIAAIAAEFATHGAVLALAALVAASLLLDLGVIGDQTLGRRAINMIRPEARGRLNGLFTGIFFVGGAFASALTGIAWTLGGWNLVCALGAAFGCGALAVSSMTLRDPTLKQ